MKKVLLLTNTSNFECHKNVIRSIDKKLKETGGYVLYVLSSYGLYREENAYEKGESSIYSLLEEVSFDGCIIDGNIANRNMYRHFAQVLQTKGIPFLTLNCGLPGVPFVSLDCYHAGCQLMEHLIQEHHCTKINMVALVGYDIITNQLMKAYKDTLQKYHIPENPDRIVTMTVSVQHGRDLFHIFRDREIDDAQAVICMHDVYCIGLCLEMEAQGYRIPEDLILCSLNRSVNSVVFRPDITGTDRMDSELAEKACEMLIQMMDGKEVPNENYCRGKVYYGQSCGCKNTQENLLSKRIQEIILAKIESGNQISRMMQYNDSLERVTSLDELGENVMNMLQGISCKEFVFCLNQRAIKYITNETEYIDSEDERPFDRTMIAVSGIMERTGKIKDFSFSIEHLLPLEVKEGDLVLFLPIHHKEHVFGYLAFVNEYLPIDIYNYRICHESIGISMENLHRQMLLHKSIEELDKLHMQDELTGLQNRFAWNRYQKKYISKEEYCVVMMDMDGLKKINDGFGHLAGNHALCITANVIKTLLPEQDLITRYGGDEFQILSYQINTEYWENMKKALNEKIHEHVAQQKLPYKLGISIGYCICSKEHPIAFEECCEIADQRMYENKKERKQCRQ